MVVWAEQWELAFLHSLEWEFKHMGREQKDEDDTGGNRVELVELKGEFYINVATS